MQLMPALPIQLRLIFLVVLYSPLTDTLAQEETETSDFHHCFFEEKSFSVGLGAIHAFETQLTGINGRLYYNLGENFCFGPEYARFSSDQMESQDLNLVAHYIFETPWLGVYPIGGINYTWEKAAEHVPEKGFGLVYGLGFHRNVRSLTFFSEYARREGDLREQSIGAGILFTFKP